jgi:hypothetical protein
MVNHWCEICVASSRSSICAVLSCRSSINMCTSCRSPTEAGTVRRRTFSTVLAYYQFSSHPRIRLNCLHLLTFQALNPSTENLDIITLNREIIYVSSLGPVIIIDQSKAGIFFECSSCKCPLPLSRL